MMPDAKLRFDFVKPEIERQDEFLIPDAFIVPDDLLVEIITDQADRFTRREPIICHGVVENRLQKIGLIDRFNWLGSPLYFSLEDARVHIKEGKKYVRVGESFFQIRGGRLTPVNLEDHPPDIHRLSGRTLDLSAPGAARYSFFLLDSLPKLGLIGAAGLSLRDFDHILVNSNAPFLKNLVRFACGADCPNIVAFNKSQPCFELERSHHFESIRLNRFTPKWIYSYLDDLFSSARLPDPGSRSFGERVYISRQRSFGRRILNEVEFSGLLTKYDFSEVFAEDYSPIELIDLMRDVEVVISPHGAGLANIIFCPPTATVIELFSSHFTQQYFNLARDRGQTYIAFPCVDAEGLNVFDRYTLKDQGKALYNREDISVPIQKLEALLNDLTG